MTISRENFRERVKRAERGAGFCPGGNSEERNGTVSPWWKMENHLKLMNRLQ